MNPHAIADDTEARSQVARELEPGEKLLWASRANPNRLARREIGAAVFAIPFLAFSLLWMAGVTSGRGFSGGTVFGLVFCAFGLWILLSPLRTRAAGARMFYGVTDRRAIIIEGAGSRRVRSWTRREIENLERAEHSDGTGDVIFDREVRRGSKGRRYTVDIGFFGIGDARYVEGLVRDLTE